jgi:4,5-DOPA dioxygenase extradiol
MTKRMPVLFVSHGSPMLALDMAAGTDYLAWGKSLPTPRAILVFSAHWEETPLCFGETTAHTQLVYDFYGFPEELYRLQYPAPGAAWLTDEISTLLNEKITHQERGLDHGVWVPFMHMWPDADVPILQMSMPHTLPDQELFDLGQRLAPLREHEVLICANGTITHNLREGLRGRLTHPPTWVTDFDRWVEQCLLHNRQALLNWRNEAPQAQRNHPSPEHFRPLLIAAGAAVEDDSVGFPVSGFEMMAFSRRAVQFG